MRLEKILLPLDGSQLSHLALPLATYLARRFQARLSLVRSVSGDETEDSARAELAEVEHGFTPEVEHKSMVLEGEPAEAILDFITLDSVDLVIMNSHGRSGVSRWLLGSVTEKVARHTHCPVFVVRGRPVEQLNKLVVPLDGSKFAEEALVYATALLEEEGEILLVRAQGDLVEPETVHRYMNLIGGNLVERGIHCRRMISEKDPADAILEVCQEQGADAVVMSTHGRTGVSRFLLGSVAEKVLRHNLQPTLLVRPEAARGLNALLKEESLSLGFTNI